MGVFNIEGCGSEFKIVWRIDKYYFRYVFIFGFKSYLEFLTIFSLLLVLLQLLFLQVSAHRISELLLLRLQFYQR